MLTRDQLVKPKTKQITIDGGDVIIRALTADESFDLRGKDVQKAEIYGVISQSLVDPVLTVEDVGSLPAETLTKLIDEIFTFNKLGRKAVAEATEELKKTSTDDKPTT